MQQLSLMPFNPHPHPVRSARTLRDKAIERASKRAGIVWTTKARDLFWEYCRGHQEFMIEEARMWIHEQGLATPKSERVYGAITRYAVSKGWIERIGTGETSNPLAHGAMAGRWRSRILRGE